MNYISQKVNLHEKLDSFQRILIRRKRKYFHLKEPEIDEGEEITFTSRKEFGSPSHLYLLFNFSMIIQKNIGHKNLEKHILLSRLEWIQFLPDIWN
jgi:hypothetical protein